MSEIEKLMGKIDVEVVGLPPGLLMNKPNVDSFRKKSRVATKEWDSKEEAEKSRYIDTINGKEQLYIPAEAFYGSLLTGAKGYKHGRSSLRTMIMGAINIEPEKIPLGHCNYKIDERTVVIQGNRVLRARANVPVWKAKFNIFYFRKLVQPTMIVRIKDALEDAGIRVGILDFRPAHTGPFGRFLIQKYQPQ